MDLRGFLANLIMAEAGRGNKMIKRHPREALAGAGGSLQSWPVVLFWLVINQGAWLPGLS